MAEKTPEQIREEQERWERTHPGAKKSLFDRNTSRSDELKRQPSAMSSGGDPPIKGRKASRKRQEADGVTPEMEALVPDPSTVASVPTTPWGLYTHFKKAVWKKWPNAEITRHNPFMIKLAKQLLTSFDNAAIYEIIQVLILDYENLKGSRIYLKDKDSPVPSFPQLVFGSDTLAKFIGVGLPLPGKPSAYMDDYNRRHGRPAADNVSTNEDLIRRLEAASDDDPTKVAK